MTEASLPLSSLLSRDQGRFVEVDDGHIPEILKNSEKQGRTRLLCYDDASTMGNDDIEGTSFVQVRDDKVSEDLVSELYKKTLEWSPSPWGTYVTMKEAKAEALARAAGSTITKDIESSCSAGTVGSTDLQTLSTRLVAEIVTLVEKEDPESIGDVFTKTNADHSGTTPIQSLLAAHRVHGVALWGLASQCHDQVRYHLDYAELLRYEHNIIVPPILAGTLQCTPVRVNGGAFCVNLDGIKHYLRYGYKAAKTTKNACDGNNDSFAGWKPPLIDTTTQGDHTLVHFDSSTQWMTIPYRSNRLILHSGRFPHLSTPIEHIDGGHKRVIIGLNFFCEDYGPMVQLSPEHSDAFVARVKHLRRQRQERSKTLSLESVLKNKSLSKLLVLAKREKVKQQLLKEQQMLDDEIQEMLSQSSVLCDDPSSYGGGSTLTVKDVVQRLVANAHTCNGGGRRQDADYRTESNVLVHIHHRVVGTAAATATRHEDSSDTENKTKNATCLDMYCPICDSHDLPSCSCRTEDGLIPSHVHLRLCRRRTEGQ